MVAMQSMQAIPQLAQQYDIGKVFAFMMNKSGLKHLEQFLLQQQPQVTPEQQIAATVQQPTSSATTTNSPVDEAQYQQQVNQALGAINGDQVSTTGSEQGSGVPQ